MYQYQLRKVHLYESQTNFFVFQLFILPKFIWHINRILISLCYFSVGFVEEGETQEQENTYIFVR